MKAFFITTILSGLAYCSYAVPYHRHHHRHYRPDYHYYRGHSYRGNYPGRHTKADIAAPLPPGPPKKHHFPPAPPPPPQVWP